MAEGSEAIDTAPSVHWVLVSERTPVDEGYVLITTQWGDNQRSVGIADYFNGKFFDDQGGRINHVVAWADYPEPYRGAIQ